MSRLLLVLPLLLLALAGCAKTPQHRQFADESYVNAALRLPMGQSDAELTTTSITQQITQPFDANTPMPPRLGDDLAGRTLAVASAADIVLKRGEVILTFDDGPRPGRTTAILDTLDAYGVKATFLMVGHMAAAHPETAQLVALRGHTIGTHTYDHSDLSTLARDAAIAEITKGERAVERALAPIGAAPAPFFRFPYLSQTGFLRTSLATDQMVILDVDIDSKDYFNSTPDEVAERTLRLLDRRGGGVILFHDVHARTVAMLPGFLEALQERGYKVVRLVPRGTGPFDTDLLTAQMSGLRAGLEAL